MIIEQNIVITSESGGGIFLFFIFSGAVFILIFQTLENGMKGLTSEDCALDELCTVTYCYNYAVKVVLYLGNTVPNAAARFHWLERICIRFI